MAFGITDLKKGTVFQLDGEPYKVLDYAQKVMGRGGSIVNVKIKSLIDGKVLDKTFKGNEAVERADVTQKTVQFLYSDGTMHHFMDQATYEQFELASSELEHQNGYMKEGDNVTVLLFDGRPISIDLAKNVPLKVTYTETVVKGDTSSAITKDAMLETGITIKVPAFIKQGDLISVDTSTGVYRARVTNSGESG